MKKYKRKFLIGSLKQLSIRLGENPTSYDVGRKNNMPDRSVFELEFGSWNHALIASKLKVNNYYRIWSEEEILDLLRKKSKEIGKCPTQRDLDKDRLMPSKGVCRKFFGSFNNAMREAGLIVNYKINREELIIILRKLYSELNRTPTREEINERGDCPSILPFVKKFGSYTAACLRAGLTPNDGRNNNIWKAWQKHCEEMAEALYGSIISQFKDEEVGIPDIFVPNKQMFIEVKTCGYRGFEDQIRRYCSNGRKLEFWCIFKGIETKNNNVEYVYSEELARSMKLIGRGDLAIKCHQFKNNVFDETQTILVAN